MYVCSLPQECLGGWTFQMREQSRGEPGKQHVHILHRTAVRTALRVTWFRLPGFQACGGRGRGGGAREEEGGPPPSPIATSPTIAMLAFFFLFIFFFFFFLFFSYYTAQAVLALVGLPLLSAGLTGTYRHSEFITLTLKPRSIYLECEPGFSLY